MPGSATNGTTIPIGFDLSQIVADARKLTASMNEITTSVNSFSDSVKTNFGQMAEAMKTINTTVESIAKSGFKELSDTVNSLDFKSTIDQMKELVELMGKIEIKQSAAGSKGGGSGGGSSKEAKETEAVLESIIDKTKSWSHEIASGVITMRGVTETGASVVEVYDAQNKLVRQTVTATDRNVDSSRQLLTTLREQTAEMNKQKTLYVDMMKNPSALPSDQLAAQRAYEESRSKVTGTMNTINNATQIRDIISGVDSALASAQSKLDSAEAQVNRIMTSVNEANKQGAAQAYADKVKQATDNLNKQLALRKQIASLEQKAVTASSGTRKRYQEEADALKQKLAALDQEYESLLSNTSALRDEASLQELVAKNTEESAKAALDLENAVDKAQKKTLTLEEAFEQIQIKLVRMVTEKAFDFITDQIKDAVEYCTTFYDKLNEIRIVTGKTQEEADAVGKSFRDIAREMGVSSQDIAASGITYYRQGLDDDDVQKRLKATIEYAKAASVEAETASEYITAATNALGIEAEHVADVYLYLADNAATSGEEIGQAMSRASGTAKAAGISFEMLGAYIATVSETTRQDAGSIGTALNAIMSRLTQVKQKGFSEEDGTKVNDVAKALKTVGIELVDVNGNWQNMEDIFMEVGKQWDTLSDKQQNYLATILAGTRQQNVFRIIMEDLSGVEEGMSRVMELYEGTMGADGTAEKKMSVWQESYVASQQNLVAEWEEFVSHFDVTPLLIQLNNGIANLLHIVNEATGETDNRTPRERAIDELRQGSYQNLVKTGELTNQIASDIEKINNESQAMHNPFEGMYDKDNFEEFAFEVQSAIANIRALTQGGIDPTDTGDPMLLAVYKAFFPNGEYDSQLYKIWSDHALDLIDGVTEAVDEAVGEADSAVVPLEKFTTEYVEKTSNVFKKTYDEVLKGTNIPQGEVGMSFSKRILSLLYGDDFMGKALPSSFADEIDQFSMQYVQDYAAMMQSAIDMYNADFSTDVSKASAAYDSFEKKLAAFNSTYQTNFSMKSIYDILFPDDGKKLNSGFQFLDNYFAGIQKKEEEMADALQAKWDALPGKMIDAQIDEKKSKGFIEELEKLGKQLRIADVVAIDEGAKAYTDALNEHFADAIADPKVYEAFEKEYSQLSLLQGALEKGDSAQAWIYYHEMMAEAAKKNEKALTDEEKAIQKENEDWEKWVADQIAQENRSGLKETNYAPWVEQIFGFADKQDGKGMYDWLKKQNKTLRDDFASLYPDLQKLINVILGANGEVTWTEELVGDFERLKANLPTAEDTKKLDAFLKTVQKSNQKAKVEEAKKNNFAVERGQLMSFFSAGRNDIISQLQGYMNGNVDLTLRPVIDTSELKKAGWNEEGGGIATLFSETFANHAGTIGFTATPILPNGKVLTQKEFYEYIDQLMTFSNASEMIKFDKKNKGLLINWLGIPEGEGVEEFLNEYAKVGEALHNLHEQLYAGDSRSGFDQAGLLSQLMTWQEDGTLAAMYSSIEGLEPLISEIMLDGQDGFINNSESLTKLQELLFSTKSAWDLYTESVKKAANNTIDPSKRIPLLQSAKSAYANNGLAGLQALGLSAKELEYLKSAVDLDGITTGALTATEAINEFEEAIADLNFDNLQKGHEIWSEAGKWVDAAFSGKDVGKAQSDALNKVTELMQGMEALSLIQQGLLTDTNLQTEAYKRLSEATGLDVEVLKGPNGLANAQDYLQMSAQQMLGTMEYLLSTLQQMEGVYIDPNNVAGSLDAIIASGSPAAQTIARVVQQLMQASGTWVTDWKFRMTTEGGISASPLGGALANFISGGASGIASFISGLFGSGKTSLQTTNSSRSRGGGGGGKSDAEKAAELEKKRKSEIEKLVHMMEEVQKIWDHHISMLQAVRNDYEQDKLLQGVILYYQKESDAIAENNKVLEDNVKRLEALLPQQQALVDSMSTTDERYEKAASDLEKLQKAHQDYSKALIENQTKIKEYAEKIKETRDKIRDMEIDLRNTILKAIQDREALEKSMRDARISMEDEVYDAIKRRYEKERDLILDNAKARKDALNEEKSLLDENLNKRKEAQEQQEKQAQLLQLQQKLVRISADPTRQAERLSIQKQIKDLQDELAWSEAEDEVEAQKESIDNQIKNLDDYMEYVTAYYDDIFEHPKQLLAEVEQIMNMTDTEILDWMKANSEEWDQSSASSQAKMLEGWTTTLREMHGQLELYWDEVEYIISQGDDYIIEFLKQNSSEYREAGKLQAEAYVDQWREQLENLRLAHQSVIDDMQQYAYSPIRMNEYIEDSSSSGGGGGGGGGGKPSPTQKDEKKSFSWSQLGLPTTKDGKIDVVKIAGNAVSAVKNWWDNAETKGSGIDAISSAAPKYAGSSKGGSIIGSNRLSASTTGSANISSSDFLNTLKNSYNSAKSSVSSSISSNSLFKNAKKVLGYDLGGQTEETGFAFLHGKPGRPERVLDPMSTELFNTLVADLHEMKRIPINFGAFSAPSIDTSGTSGNNFGDIIVNVESLSSDDDYEEMADRVMEVINERMGRGRAVGGIRRSR